MKVEENLKLIIAGEGKMVGDYEAINDVPSQYSVVCHSLKGTVLVLSQEEYLQLKTVSEEAFQELTKLAQEQQNEIFKTYINKMRDTQILKQNGHEDGDQDIQKLTSNLMYEMFWDRPPTSIEKFALKKHMKDDNMTPKSLITMRHTEYQEFRNSEWAQSRMG